MHGTRPFSVTGIFFVGIVIVVGKTNIVLRGDMFTTIVCGVATFNYGELSPGRVKITRSLDFQELSWPGGGSRSNNFFLSICADNFALYP